MNGRGPAIAADIRKAIRSHVLDYPDTTAAAVTQWLEASPTLKDRRLPAPRTVQKYVRELKSIDTSGPWKPFQSEEDAETTRYLLDVLAQLANRTRRSHLTMGTVDVLKVIHKAAPDLPKFAAYRLAGTYQLRGGSTEDLDLLLAFAPWRSSWGRKRFKAVLKDLGWLRDVTQGDVEIPPGWSVHLGVMVSFGSGKSEPVTMAERGDAWALLRQIDILFAETDADDGMEDDGG